MDDMRHSATIIYFLAADFARSPKSLVAEWISQQERETRKTKLSIPLHKPVLLG
jgi:hypothetical protein